LATVIISKSKVKNLWKRRENSVGVEPLPPFFPSPSEGRGDRGEGEQGTAVVAHLAIFCHNLDAVVRVHVGSNNPIKAQAVKNVFERVFGPTEVRLLSVESGVPGQPFDDDTVRGACERARKALQDADFGVGIEAGLIWNRELKLYFDVQFCAIISQDGKLTVGHGSGFVYPPRVIEEVLQGRTVGEVMSELTGIEKIGHKGGAIGYLSKNLLTREQLTEQAVLMALIPRIRPELYAP
jgi:inosine/xanthosine triphosphatase